LAVEPPTWIPGVEIFHRPFLADRIAV